MTHTIYAITCAATGQVYVGCTKRHVRAGRKSRKGEHLRELRRGAHRNKSLQAAFDLHGEDRFSFEILEENADPWREVYWIDELNAMTPNGFNMLRPCWVRRDDGTFTQVVRKRRHPDAPRRVAAGSCDARRPYIRCYAARVDPPTFQIIVDHAARTRRSVNSTLTNLLLRGLAAEGDATAVVNQ